jgi:hypothetical protein
MGESKSARTLSDINAYSEYGAESDPICINRLAGISEWTPTKPGSRRAADRAISDDHDGNNDRQTADYLCVGNSLIGQIIADQRGGTGDHPPPAIAPGKAWRWRPLPEIWPEVRLLMRRCRPSHASVPSFAVCSKTPLPSVPDARRIAEGDGRLRRRLDPDALDLRVFVKRLDAA